MNKINKKQEKEVIQVYDTWLQSYLNGDVKTYDFYLDDDYRFIGSTDNEEFLNRKDTTEFFAKTSDQLAGKTNLKNTVRTVELIDGIVFITELFDAYFLIGTDWTYYGRFRFTSALSKKKAGWRFVYQHFSMPDSKAQDGETLGAEQISKENQELRDAIKRRTVELEQKNRELEIEASLERVRARAMAMHKSEELGEAAVLLYKELRNLGVNQFFNCGYVLVDEKNKKQHGWLTDGKGDFLDKFNLPLKGDSVLNPRYKSWKRKDPIFSQIVGGEEFKKHQAFVSAVMDSEEMEKVTFQMPDPTIFYCANFSHGYLHILSSNPLSKEEEFILVRFTSVFQMTYRRFLDLQKAEAQAREAQIELGLERVRARAMAMQNSNELSELVDTVFQELTKLDFSLTACIINIIDGDDKSNTVWVTNPETGKDPESYYLKFEDYKFHHGMWKAWKARKNSWVYTIKGAEKEIYQDYLFNETEFKRFSKNVKEGFLALERWVASFTFSNFGGLQTIGEEPLSNENLDILARFGKVFDLTYTRFNDLKQAEAQAREAQIELALERVRARTMAMHNSIELGDVATVLFKELNKLVENLWTCGFVLCEKDRAEDEWWLSDENGFIPAFYLPNTGDVTHANIYNAWKDGKTYHNEQLDGEALQEHYDWLMNIPVAKKYFEDSMEVGLEMPTWQKLHCAFFKTGYLVIITQVPCPEEDIFKRFAQVFDQTYTRFLDLKKAEAQAKEIEIELSLERVRSKAMTMTKSSDLLDIVVTMRSEFIKLGHDAHYFWHMAWLPTKYQKAMTSGDGTRIGNVMELPRDFHQNKAMMTWEKSDEPVAVFALGAESAVDYINKMVTLGDFQKIDHNAPTLDDIRHIGGLTFIMARTTHGEIGYSLPGVVKNPPTEDLDILVRFAVAFDLAHKRFEDLRQSEVQTRETKIELSLERVRSRSMAMHKSEELKEVIQVVYEEFVNLNIKIEHTGFIIDYKANDDMHIWLADEHGVHSQVTIPYFDTAHWNSFNEAKEKGMDFFANKLAFKEKNNFYKKLLKYIPGLPEEAKEFYLTCPGLAISTVLLDNVGLYIENFEGIPYADDENKILMRFGKVFQQTYTRFLDLQIAENQAKEAEIELALERVRAKTMAMQHSDELREVVRIIYKQLGTLNFDVNACNIIIMEESGGMQYWVSGFAQDIYPESYHVPNLNHPYLIAQFDAWKKEINYMVFEYSGKEKKSFDKLFFTQTEFRNVPEQAKQNMKGIKRVKLSTAFFNHGALQVLGPDPLTEENAKTLQRIAKVFNQTYTRFLDLQKAEKQARKAQIEIALERTRTQSMLMQHSDDLNEVSKVFHEQLLELNIPSEFSYVWLPNEENKDHMFWATWSENTVGSTTTKNKAITYDLDKSEPYTAACFKAWKSDQPVHISHIRSGEIDAFFATWKELLRGAKKLKPRFFSEGIYYAEAYMKYGCFGINIRRDLNKEEQQILHRFSIEFERTYTKFLNLKKAEAQAREAKIEVALEKVRSRTMAMQHSEELPEAANNLFLQVQGLGIPAWSAGYCIWEDKQKSAWCNMSSEGEIQKGFSLPTIGVGYNFYKPLKNAETFYVAELGGKKLVKHYDFMKKLPIVGKILKEFDKKGIALPTFQIFHIVYFTHGYLMFITYEKVPNEWGIFKRFGKVFNQTYTRFLDLQKAEAQAREAQTETSLERVRSSAMAMHKSEDLLVSANLLYNEFKILGFTQYFTCGFVIIDEENSEQHVWVTDMTGEIFKSFKLPLTGDPVFQHRYDEWKKKTPVFYQKVGGIKLKKHLTFASSHFGSKEAEDMVANQFPDPTFFYMANFSHGYLHIVGDMKLTDEEEVLLARFTRVFEQTYTRFIDLQKAEAQVREAQIEAALETVRSRSLAMHKTDELQEVVAVVAEKLQELGVIFDAGGVILCTYFPDNKDVVHWIAAPDFSYSGNYLVPYFDNPIFNDSWDSKIRGDAYFSKEFPVEVKNSFFSHCFEHSDYKNFPDEFKQHALQAEKHHLSAAWSNNSAIIIPSLTGVVPSESDAEIMKRFSKVFEQAYIRFLDLQKAEEQTRTAQINLAVERVRAKALAMHKSEEIMGVVAKLKDEVMHLDIPDVVAATIFLKEGDDQVRMWDLSSLEKMDDGYQVPTDIIFKLKKTDPHLYIKRVWENQENYFVETQDKKGFKRLLAFIREHDKNQVADDVSEFIETTQLKQLYHATKKLNNGKLCVDLLNPPREEMETILTKMGAAFDLAYKRFEDLQKAENQAREAQIEAALERVRAKSMAMHKTSELKMVIDVISEQFAILGIAQDACMINIFGNETSKDWNFWIATYPDLIHVPFFKNPILSRLASARKKNEAFYSLDINQEEKNKFFEHFYKLAEGVKVVRKRRNFIFKAPGWTSSVALSKYASIHLINYNRKIYTEEENQVLQRIGMVFEQTYTRFLDLQKAEEQTREAQIEASLERVRSKTMAMHNSKDVQGSVVTLFNEVLNLGIDKSIRCGIGILEGYEGMETWSATLDHNDEPDLKMGMLNMTIHPLLKGVKNWWKKGKTGFKYQLAENDVIKYYKALNDDPGYPYNANLDTLPKKEFHNSFVFAEGVLFAFTSNPLSEEAVSVLKRFTAVFEQTYTRFLDLKKAEEQVREAQIEASLERVRTQAMAMHSSEDLITTANQLFQEFQYLEISFIRCGVLKINKDKTAEVYSYSQTKDKKAVAIFGNMKLTDHELMDGVFRHWKLQKEYVHEMKGNAVKRYYKLINKQIKIPEINLSKTHFGYAFYFPEGCLYCFTNEKMTDDTLRILRKFNTVMGLTYRRYFELQEAEVRELAAIQESSLDRVRAEIASMRTADDLNRITPLVWKELTALGVPFFRCGVFIIDKEMQKVHAYLSTPSGESVAALELEFDSIPLVKGAVSHWKKQKVYIEKWNKQQFIEFTQPLIEQGQINSSKKYQGGLDAPNKLVLQMVPFKQGMLYVGSEESLTNDQISMVESLAKAFSIAYTRYEDFKELEAAKGRAEDTLYELKSTQTQLIQSEKMASLGELTAGIAHEIQNPLNFVNNFSELSEEMLEELEEEIKDNSDEIVVEIMTDLKQNLNKIANHGKRASSIVKGMLEHSRTSSGVKEPTDINALADEFLRLSYHGLRAKDKSFNADFKTDFDTSLPKIKVISQDLGRVILNLINNAFYACNQRSQSAISKDYKPTVTVSSRKNNNTIEIGIKDNGSGIPDDIKDKIFQPFFTTKPTGSGTGLGLSMSYDIITKGHGGELKVESKEGEYTEFTIVLPI